MPYTQDQLERMPIEELDQLAFGVVSGEQRQIQPSQLLIIYPCDLENPQARFDHEGMAWANSVDLSEPVSVSVNDLGQWCLEDGHHRRFSALKTNRPLQALFEVKGNPVRRLLEHGAWPAPKNFQSSPLESAGLSSIPSAHSPVQLAPSMVASRALREAYAHLCETPGLAELLAGRDAFHHKVVHAFRAQPRFETLYLAPLETPHDVSQHRPVDLKELELLKPLMVEGLQIFEGPMEQAGKMLSPSSMMQVWAISPEKLVHAQAEVRAHQLDGIPSSRARPQRSRPRG